MNKHLPLAALILLLLCLGPAAAAGLGKGEPPPLDLRIVDEMGQPVSGARVQAGNAGQDRDLHQAWSDSEEAVHTGETSAEGVVRLSGFPVERAIWVLVEKKGFLPELRSVMLSRQVPLLALLLLSLEARAESIVTGRVVDPDGKPVAGAEIWQDGDPVAVTGPDGSFRARGLDPVSGELEVCGAGWIDDDVFEYRAGLPREPLVLRVRPAGRLTGRVIDENGAPVAGASLSVNFAGWEHGPDEPWICDGHPRDGDESADDAGRFAFQRLEPGWFEIEVTAPGFAKILGLRHRVEAGRTGEIEIVLSRGLILEGSVRGVDGEPIPGVKVRWNGRGSGETDAEGRFRLSGVTPGWGWISAEHPERGWIDQEIEVDRSRSLDLVLLPVTPIRGLVLDPAGEPAQEMSLTLGTRYFEVRPDGRFEILAPPGEHAISFFHHTHGEVVKRVQAQGRPIDLTVRFPRMARITGQVTGLPPGEEAQVLAKSGQKDLEPGEQEVEENRYQIHLPPGEWTVLAEDLRGRILERRVRLEEEGEEARADFRFPPLPRVRGRVLGPGGEPQDRVKVTFTRGASTIESWSGPGGVFEAHLTEGTWEVRAEKPGLGPSLLAPFTVPGESVEMPPLRLSEPVTVSGRVLGLEPGEVVGQVSVRDGSGRERGEKARTDQENRFTIRDLGPGLWTLEARLENRAAVGTIRIAPDQRTAQLDLTFAAGEETLTGQVLRVGDWHHFWVEVQRIEEPSVWIYTDVSSEGHFKIPSLPPGHYRVQAIENDADRLRQRILGEVVTEVPGKPAVIDLSDFTPSPRGQR